MNSAIYALRVHDLERQFADRPVVSALEFSIRPGEIVGLLGLNGAGKSTALAMIAGVLAPTRGRVEVAGADLAADPIAARRRLGYLPDRPPLYDDLTVGEYLRFAARLRGLDRVGARRACARVLTLCHLEGVANRRIGNLSKGLRQRVGLAQALVHEPALLVLDEPASGLDPIQRAELNDLLRDVAGGPTAEGSGQPATAVLVSTHAIGDVHASCRRALLLHDGKLVVDRDLSKAPTQDRTPPSRDAGSAGPGFDGETPSQWIVGLARPPAEDCLRALPSVHSVQRLEPEAPATAPSGRFLVAADAGSGAGDVLARAALDGNWGLIELRRAETVASPPETQAQSDLEALFMRLARGEALAETDSRSAP